MVNVSAGVTKSMATRSARESPALEDLPNVGPAIAADLRTLGIRRPSQLKGRNPYALYERLNRVTGARHDPSVLDTIIAAVRFVDGGPAKPWWAYTTERRRVVAARARSEAPPVPSREATQQPTRDVTPWSSSKEAASRGRARPTTSPRARRSTKAAGRRSS